MRPSLVPLRLALFASFGLFSAGCSGRTETNEGNLGDGGTAGGGSSGGNPAAGGTAAAGASTTPQVGAAGAAGTLMTTGAGGATVAKTIGACVDPKPIVDADGADTGFVTCADGGVDRVVAQTIAFAVVDAPYCAEAKFGCKTHADCPGVMTVCVGEGPQCGCETGCSSDADCADGQACALAPADQNHSQCVPATCQSNADCASGRCGLGQTIAMFEGCGEVYGLACRTPSDPCVKIGTACGDGPNDVCVLVGSGFGCDSSTAACGRPLLVDGAPRVATRALRRDWTAEIDIDTSDLTRSEQSSLADHWLAIAALEHASIASFARFSMQLLGLGAPAELVEEATAAMRDEVEHARIAYAIAGQYANSPVGPAPLDLSGVIIAMDESEIVETLAREGCVGETIGAAEARVAAAGVSDRMLKSALVRIADDETRHAALAWKTLAWMLAGGDHELRATAARALDDAMNEIARMRIPDALGTPTHGLLSSNELRSLRRDALEQVLRPCAASLTG